MTVSGVRKTNAFLQPLQLGLKKNILLVYNTKDPTCFVVMLSIYHVYNCYLIYLYTLVLLHLFYVLKPLSQHGATV